jgi:hypothetical protein
VRPPRAEKQVRDVHLPLPRSGAPAMRPESRSGPGNPWHGAAGRSSTPTRSPHADATHVARRNASWCAHARSCTGCSGRAGGAAEARCRRSGR